MNSGWTKKFQCVAASSNGTRRDAAVERRRFVPFTVMTPPMLPGNISHTLQIGIEGSIFQGIMRPIVRFGKRLHHV
jgi:hypothetical protein